MKYVVYLDESRITSSKYSSICAVSLPVPSWRRVKDGMAEIQNANAVTDLKWEKVRNNKYQIAAEGAFEKTIAEFIPLGLRIDSICWNNQDSRHAIAGRDDLKNYERMFYHLLCSLMTKREAGSVWGVYPDQLSGIDWGAAERCINAAGKKVSQQMELPEVGRDLGERYAIKRFEEADSREKPLVQLADLFAGMSAFSVLSFEKYSFWQQDHHPTQDLFAVPGQHTYSNSEKVKFSVLDKFKQSCDEQRLGVSLGSTMGLRTLKPSNPLNFWRYEPQGAYDKAPTKSSKLVHSIHRG